jgi:hypothetical protein
MGGFAGGPSQVAARQPSPGGIMANIQPASIEGTGNFKPTNFQELMGRQAMEGDPSQRAKLLKATGLDASGSNRMNPRGLDNPGILDMLKAQSLAKTDQSSVGLLDILKPKAPSAAPAAPSGGILSSLFGGSNPIGSGLSQGGGLLSKLLGALF